MAKKVTTRTSGSDCILIVVLKGFCLQLSYILAKHFDMYLKQSCFLEC